MQKLLTRIGIFAFALMLSYILVAYEFIPSTLRFVERRHPALEAAGTHSFTASNTPGDPFNVAFIGTTEQLITLLDTAGWVPADPITLKSSIEIVVASAAKKAYPTAPVSPLFVVGKPQDFAFETAAGIDPSTRHHVRFWLRPEVDLLGRKFFIGSATFDTSVGFSHQTGQITHHVATNIDDERNKLVSDLQRTQKMSLTWISDFQESPVGKNGGGDTYQTDRRLALIEAK
jgi:LssY C-terminus